MRKAALALLVLAVILVSAGAYVYARRPRQEADSAPAPRASSVDAPLTLPSGLVDVVIVGGGAEPESSGVQLEQDVELASRVLRGARFVLFGAGRGPLAVRTNGPVARDASSVRGLLAELFDPRDRAARYRPARIALDAPASRMNLLRVLGAQTERPGGTLTLFIAAHGTAAEDPIETTVDLWSADVLSVRDLVDVYASAQRPIVSVITSCYGGAFADTALANAGDVVSCGLFATTEDRVASGCDTNPARSAQEGFALHFLNALRGTDRDGRALADALDLDHDGRVSYLEAHARARIASRGFDVPTTTSERFLRALTTDREIDVDALTPVPDPVEDAVIAALGRELDARELPVARAMLTRIGDELAALDADSLDAETRRDEAYRRLRIVLLERWPLLDDPWHPDHAATIAREGASIQAVLASRPELRTYRAEGARLDTLADAYDEKVLEESRVARLVRAMENVRMLAFLEGAGEEARARHAALRACERGP